MGEIINVIKQVINSENIGVAVIGLLFILIGIAIGVFKQTWLIAGSSALSYMEDEAVDYIAIFFGLLIGILGGVLLLGAFIGTYFDNIFSINIGGILPFLIAFILAILCLIVIGIYKKKKEKKPNMKLFTKVKKKKILFFAGLMFIAWVSTYCDGKENCGFCKNLTYDNGVKTKESSETEYCGADWIAQKTKPDVTVGSLVTKTVCRQ